MEQTDKRKQDKLKFDRVINLARRLPQPAIHDLLRALILPIQADYLLAVGTEGQDARPDMNEREFFFTKIIWAMDWGSKRESQKIPSFRMMKIQSTPRLT
ncbi:MULTISPECIES: hypothetical protein [Enterobacteriaceae]|uniref:hypothetical protein n=1 Tax=Enterobacteriaceae TaxID=543 RepID=UPI0022CDA31D|nr:MULTISPECIES: hypothetical protein [Enterobacteriaceae]